MKQKIVEYIKKNKAVSYAELEYFFKECGYDYEGEAASFSDVNDSVIFWQGWNAKTFKLLSELIKEKAIHREPCQPFIYLLDGKALTYPIVKTNTKYKTVHWLPCVFMIGADETV